MKLLVASDIHGSGVCCAQMLQRYEEEGASRLLLLGDILYHGPRNDLPEGYDPKAVMAMLNPLHERIWAIRGNCDAEVDQMVLDFPVMADYCILPVGEKAIYCTHGHIYHAGHRPPMAKGDVLLHGHTHIYEVRRDPDITVLNPGSVSLPKGGNPRTYATLEDGLFRICTMQGEELTRIDVNEE